MCADEADGRLFPGVLVEQCSGLDVCQGFCCESDSTLSKNGWGGVWVWVGLWAQEELLLFRNQGDLRYGRAGNRDFGNLSAWETAVCCLLHLTKQKLLPSVNAPVARICTECSSGWSEEG